MLVPIVCLGQSAPTTKGTSVVTVIVKDELGAAIGNAFVLLRTDSLERENPAPFSAEIRTEKSGVTAKSVPQGFYDLFVASTGFAPYCQKLRVRVGEPAKIQVRLKVDKLMLREYGDTFGTPKKQTHQ